MIKAKSLLDINHNETYAPDIKILEYIKVLQHMEEHNQEALVDFTRREIEENNTAQKLLAKLKAIRADPKIEISAFLCILILTRNDIQGKLWAYTTQEIFKEILRPLSINDILIHFPKGLPTEKQHNDIWQANNTKNHNLIDQPKTYGLEKFI